ncbi:hypothetical protein BJX61DRAFT_218332 [Aspergillus egyptiacus]|nr:hypothetical protein BJX61DRAFT_218332 [Aspergillus egyptiacus]
MPSRRHKRDLVVPDITEDAAERKRVLNVLAQRRYRKRKRDRLQSLQAQVEKQNRSTASDPQTPVHLTEPSQPQPQLSTQDADVLESSGVINDPNIESALDFAVPDIDIVSSELFSLFSTPNASDLQAFTTPQIPPDLNGPFAYLQPVPAMQPPRELIPDSSTTASNLLAWSDSIPSSHNTSPSSTNADTGTDTDTALTLSDHLQTSQSSTFTFPDDHILQIPSLRLLNAAMKVALRLNIAHLLWDMTATSPFCTSPAVADSESASPSSSSSLSSSYASSTPPIKQIQTLKIVDLPPHLHPTLTQRSIPHHPVLDILPWPATRDKLIQIFNLPAPLRPRAAQDPLGKLRLVYDMEDESGEGIRIHGGDVFELRNWEIGQVVFERWWWAFEGGVVEECDRARRGRGEGGLVVTLLDADKDSG